METFSRLDGNRVDEKLNLSVRRVAVAMKQHAGHPGAEDRKSRECEPGRGGLATLSEMNFPAEMRLIEFVYQYGVDHDCQTEFLLVNLRFISSHPGSFPRSDYRDDR
jgi:hypothetical protein